MPRLAGPVRPMARRGRRGARGLTHRVEAQDDAAGTAGLAVLAEQSVSATRKAAVQRHERTPTGASDPPSTRLRARILRHLPLRPGGVPPAATSCPTSPDAALVAACLWTRRWQRSPLGERAETRGTSPLRAAAARRVRCPCRRIGRRRWWRPPAVPESAPPRQPSALGRGERRAISGGAWSTGDTSRTGGRAGGAHSTGWRSRAGRTCAADGSIPGDRRSSKRDRPLAGALRRRPDGYPRRRRRLRTHRRRWACHPTAATAAVGASLAGPAAP
jgi:hypothetical protein